MVRTWDGWSLETHRTFVIVLFGIVGSYPIRDIDNCVWKFCVKLRAQGMADAHSKDSYGHYINWAMEKAGLLRSKIFNYIKSIIFQIWIAN
jgi:hypothetical protein